MQKVKSLWNKESCGLKHRYGNLETTKGKAFANGLVMKELFTTHGMNFKVKDIEDIINYNIADSLFQTEREKNLNSQLLTQKIMRLKSEVDKHSGIVEPGKCVVLELYGEQFEASCHFIRVNDKANTVDVCFVKNKKRDLTISGRSEQTRISKSMELYILQKLGEELYPSYHVNGVIYYLSSSNDSGATLSPVFDNNKQVASYHFCLTEKTDMEDRLNKLIGLDETHFPCEGKCEDCTYHTICSYHEKDEIELETTTVAKAPGTVTFTTAQQEFIDIETGIYRVLAGAGSGKTTSIANRMIELLTKGYFPEEILLITYTTKGVEELKEKLDYWLHVNFMDEDYPIERFQIFTFNGFGFELIKQEYEKFGFTDIPKVLDKYENMRIIKQLLDSHDEIQGLNYVNPFMSYFNSKGAVLQIDEWFKQIKTEGLVYPEEVEESLKIPIHIAEEVLVLYQEYDEYYKSNNFVDFNDQVEMLSTLFDDPDMLDTYGFKHIMVDEYQDSDNLQTEILKKLLKYKDFRSFVVVGDDSQAIYSWRGATSENIIKFDTLFKDVIDIQMVENFRSTKPIIRLANNLNDINKMKVPKDLIAHKDGELVELLNGDDIRTLAERIEDDIKTGKLNYSDIALISRNKKDLLIAQQYFSLKNIPTVLATSELLIDNNKIKILTDFANFLVDPNMDLGFAEYCKLTDYENFSSEEKKNLGNYLTKKRSELFGELTKTTPYFFFLNTLYELGKEDKAINKLAEVIKDKSLKTIKEIANFLSDMKTFEADYYIEKVEDKVNAVTLTTAHSSKGREWPNVYVYLNKFKYPKHYNLFAPEKNTFMVEEERRLLFVAVTRAKEKLTLLGDKNSEIYMEVAQCKRKR